MKIIKYISIAIFGPILIFIFFAFLSGFIKAYDLERNCEKVYFDKKENRCVNKVVFRDRTQCIEYKDTIVTYYYYKCPN